MRILLCLACLTAASTPAAAERGRFGLSAGLMMPSDLEVGRRRTEARPGPLVVFSFDQAVAGWLDVGAFLHTGSIQAETRRGEQINVFELGVAAHHRLQIGAGLLRSGVGVGFRRLFADLPRYDRINGLGLNLDAEYSRRLYRRLWFQGRMGLMSQPFGSNGEEDVRWVPFPYFAFGFVI